MRKSALAFALSLFAAVPASAFFEANVAGGYTTLAMGELNDLIAKASPANNTQIKSGFYVTADAGITLLPFLKLSPRVGLIAGSQGKTTGLLSETTIDTMLFPMELGLAADISIPLSGLSARAGVWGGVGMATLATGTKTAGVLTNSAYYSGNGFTAEALAALRYSIVPFLSLSLEAGYRLANISKVADSNGKDLKKNATDAAAIDFSGANVGGGLTFSF